FEADVKRCPSGAFVGGASVQTPALAKALRGPAILVSHAGASFPDLDLVLEGAGVRLVLTGTTEIKRGATTTTFSSLPDVPITSVKLNLPAGGHSALTGNGDLCAHKLIMPTWIVGQNGVQLKYHTRVNVS